MVRLWKSHALALSLVFAVAGFCHAINTSSPVQPGASAGARAVGTNIPLNFTNPPVAGFGTNTAPQNTQDFDLGDACFGSVITRFITAEGGLKPYRFTSIGPLSLQNVVAGTPNSLQLGLSGVLAGSAPLAISAASTTITGAPGLRFFVQVQDAKGSTSTSSAFFNLFLVDCRTSFAFATPSQLPFGRLATSYSSVIAVVGGTPAYIFSTPGVPDGQVVPGLFLTSDGALFGRPLALGTFTFTVHCVDARKTVALNRAHTAPDQAFTITINDNAFNSTDVVTLSCSVKGANPTNGGDSLRYKGLINVLGQDTFSLLNSDFSFRIGSVVYAGRMDKRGQFKQTFPDHSKFTAKINTRSGTLNVSIRDGSFATALNAGALVDHGTARKPLEVVVGDAVDSSEILDFDSSVRGNGYGLNFALGRSGTNPAGAFQIYSVKGKDGITLGGQSGDAWQVNFFAVPRTAIANAKGQSAGFDDVTVATVRIGGNFSQTLNRASTSFGSPNFSFKGQITDGVKQISLTGQSFKGKLTTNVLNQIATSIPLASQAPGFGTHFFSLGLDLQRSGTGAPFNGEHARRIFGLGNQYRDVPPK